MMHETLLDALRAQFGPSLYQLALPSTWIDAGTLALFAFAVIVIFG